MSRKTMVRIAIAIVLLALVIGGGWWVWSVGAPQADRAHAFQVRNVLGQVEWKQKGASEWRPITNAQAVSAGDAIRTAEGASAEIQWDGRGVTRLDAKTQIVIQEAPTDPSSDLKTHTTLQVDAGRIWSRLMKLLDVESSFEVRTDSVVATVRGTTFGFERSASGTHVAVAESVVNVQSLEDVGAAALLRDRQAGEFTETGHATSVHDLTNADEWAAQNSARDQALDEEIRTDIGQRLDRIRGKAPEWVIELSERARLMMGTPDQQSDLAAAFLARRLAVAQIDPSHARQIVGDVDLAVLRGPGLERALRDVRDMLIFNKPRAGFTPEAGWFETLRTLRATLLTQASRTDAYARALVIDDSIDDALFPPSPLSADDLRARVIDLNGQVTAWERAYGTTEALRKKAEAMRDRLTGFGLAGVVTAPPASQLPPLVPINAVSTTEVLVPVSQPNGTSGQGSGSGQNSGQQTGISVTTTQPTTNQTSFCTQPMLAMIPSPGSVQVGQSVALQLFATCQDGRMQDWSSRATFTLTDPSFGQISGAVFVPSKDGTINIRGLVSDGTTMRGATGTVTVTKVTKTLTGVRAVAVGPTSLTTGQSSPLDATATYSDNSTMDIKYQCVWSTSNPRLAMVSNATFQSLSGTGSVSAICSYTESGITKTGSVDFTISLDPSLTPTGGGTPTQTPRSPNSFTAVP